MAKYLQKDMRERWASAGNVAIPSTEKTAEGWIEEIPPSELANFIENRQDEAIAYLMQQGIAEWLNNLEYQPSSRIQYAGVVYKALSVNINQQPNTNPLIWQPAFDEFGAAQAVQDVFDDFIAQDDPLPQYVQDALMQAFTQKVKSFILMPPKSMKLLKFFRQSTITSSLNLFVFCPSRQFTLILMPASMQFFGNMNIILLTVARF